jgi:pimeloyl-ACP methyl ester carboxylesterase
MDATFALYDAQSVEDRLGEITPPTFVIHGLADVSTPLERGTRVANDVPDSRGLLLVEGGPHALNLTHSALVNEETRKFVDVVTREFEASRTVA